MIRLCVVGSGSFVGRAVMRHLLKEHPDEVEIAEVDTIGDAWRSEDFSRYDSLFYVSGVVPWALDRKVLGLGSDDEVQKYLDGINADLAYEIASKAKADGARHVTFMSTSDVYAKSPSADPRYTIDGSTKPLPESQYGRSKLNAELRLSTLADGTFGIATLRPPLIYGPNCTKGSFASLAKLAARTPVFPKVKNARSMLYTGNLAELVLALATDGVAGVFLPQDPEWVCTSELVCLLGEAQGNSVRLSGMLGLPCAALAGKSSLFRKLFGNFRYEQEHSLVSYQKYHLAEAVARSMAAAQQAPEGVLRNMRSALGHE